MISKKEQRDSGIFPPSWAEELKLSLVFVGKVKPAKYLKRLNQINLYCCYLFAFVRQLHQPISRYLTALFPKNQQILDRRAMKHEDEKSKLFFAYLHETISNVLANFIRRELVFKTSFTFFIPSFRFYFLFTFTPRSFLAICRSNPLRYFLQFFASFLAFPIASWMTSSRQ